jgi:hypothetical protein
MCPKESEIFDCVWRTVTCDPKSCNYSLKKNKNSKPELLACLFVCLFVS